jgi:O-antigen/teichoic acid export membrane protein
MLLSIGLAVLLPYAFEIPETDRASVQLVVIVAGATMAVSLVGGVFGGILVGLQRFDLSNSVELSGALLRTIVIVVLLQQGGGIVALALIQFAFTALKVGTHALLGYRLYPELSIQLFRLYPETAKLIVSFSTYSFLVHLANYVHMYSDSVVIGAFLPVEHVTWFIIAGNLIQYAKQFGECRGCAWR